MKLIALVFNAAVFSCLLHPEGVVSRVLDQEGLEALKKEVGNLEKIIPIVQEEQKLEELIGDFGDEV